MLQFRAIHFCAGALQISKHVSFQEEAQRIMDRLDAASAWEVVHCRAIVKTNRIRIKSLPDYGDYWQLADRSIGHTIAALGVLFAGGFKSTSPTTRALRSFFKHYLIARQLNDDAHDWEEDLKHGHINAAAVLILQKYFELHGITKKVIDLQKDGDLLRSIMWNGVIIDICDQIDRQVKMAQNALRTHNSQLDYTILSKLFNSHRKSCTAYAHSTHQNLTIYSCPIKYLS